MMSKAIHAQENRKAAREKAEQVARDLRQMKLSAAAKKVEDSIEETLTFMNFPSQHWTRIRTNNTLRHVAGTDWGTKRYMNMDHLLEMDAELNESKVGWLQATERSKQYLRKTYWHYHEVFPGLRIWGAVLGLYMAIYINEKTLNNLFVIMFILLRVLRFMQRLVL